MIAKLHVVARVVLFSSPWDTYGRDHRPAAWLSEPSATPPDRWWAARHVRERTTDLIANAYRALAIPPEHILLLKGDLRPGAAERSVNPYHNSTAHDPQYEKDWRKLYGAPTR